MDHYSETAAVVLDGNASLAEISATYNDITSALQAKMAVCIDIGPADAVDLSALQLIVAARRYAIVTGGSISLTTAAPPMLVALLHRAGFVAAAGTADHQFWFHGESAQ